MVGISLRAAGIVALLAAALYQTFLRRALLKFGVGRTIQPITDFPYQCRRLSHDGMEACEDMWLDETNRQLYLACSNIVSRRSWFPNGASLNESALHTKDSVFVLDIDKPVKESFRLRKLASSAFYGTSGEGSIHLLSVSGRNVPGSTKVELYLINNKPSLTSGSETRGALADNSRTGANSTIELFEVDPSTTSMKHIRTFSHPLIASPNNVALVPDGSGIYISNDHGQYKTGLNYHLSPVLKTGNVVYCARAQLDSAGDTDCRVVASGLSYPNGLTISPLDPKTLYVPSAGLGKGISIFKIHGGGHLTKVSELEVPYPIDNLTPNADGAIYAAVFPKPLKTIQSFVDPYTFRTGIAARDRKTPPATVLKINKIKNLVNDGHEVTWTWGKVVEDANGQVLPSMTTVVHDAKSGRLFMSGVFSYFITVCEPV